MSADNELDLEHFHSLLTEKQTSLCNIAEAGDVAAQTVELDQTRVGRLSRMDAMQGQAMSQETQRRRKLELKRIEAALQRIQEGEYGYCLLCDQLIPHGRLEIDPAAPLCVACAERTD